MGRERAILADIANSSTATLVTVPLASETQSAWRLSVNYSRARLRFQLPAPNRHLVSIVFIQTLQRTCRGQQGAALGLCLRSLEKSKWRGRKESHCHSGFTKAPGSSRCCLSKTSLLWSAPFSVLTELYFDLASITVRVVPGSMSVPGRLLVISGLLILTNEGGLDRIGNAVCTLLFLQPSSNKSRRRLKAPRVPLRTQNGILQAIIHMTFCIAILKQGKALASDPDFAGSNCYRSDLECSPVKDAALRTMGCKRSLTHRLNSVCCRRKARMRRLSTLPVSLVSHGLIRHARTTLRDFVSADSSDSVFGPGPRTGDPCQFDSDCPQNGRCATKGECECKESYLHIHRLCWQSELVISDLFSGDHTKPFQPYHHPKDRVSLMNSVQALGQVQNVSEAPVSVRKELCP